MGYLRGEVGVITTCLILDALAPFLESYSLPTDGWLEQHWWLFDDMTAEAAARCQDELFDTMEGVEDGWE